LEPELDERLRCLEGCLLKLTMQERQMVTHRYALSRGAEEMMEQFSMSRRTLFRNLEMLRKRLHECVSRELRTEGLA
jgi:RNA polymerase sigma-70 factor (ECF subfamily)